MDSNFRLIGDLLVIGGTAAAFLISRWWRNRPTPPTNLDQPDVNASILISAYTLGVGVKKMAEGTIKGLHYDLILTTNQAIPSVTSEVYVLGTPVEVTHKDIPTPEGVVPAPQGEVIFILDLPFASSVHIAGFSLKDETFRALIGNTNVAASMSQVELEGNFPDYFKLYCSPGREIELREILDPSSMAFLVDFCSLFNFELVGSNLYFNQSDKTRGPENLVEAAEGFADKILPVLQRMTPQKTPLAKLN